MTEMTLAIAAGGTGGHVYPALAVAQKLMECHPGASVNWIGTARGIEAKLIPTHQIPLHMTSIQGLRGKGLKAKLSTLYYVLTATIASIKWLRQVRPDVLLAMGGYVAGPAGCAAFILGIPVVIHEQNARMGLTNRLLAKIAKRIVWGLPNPLEARYANKGIRLGNPIRQSFDSLMPVKQRFQLKREQLSGQKKENRIRILVLGGSLGAQAINEAMPMVLEKVRQQHVSDVEASSTEHTGIDVIHQCGEHHLNATCEQYSQFAFKLTGSQQQQDYFTVKVVPFIENVAEQLAWSDFVVCRAGALTVSELAAAGVGAILVPFPFAVDDHQACNADVLVAKGAAEVVAQGYGFVERLYLTVNSWLNLDLSSLAKKGHNANLLSCPNASQQIVQLLFDVVCE